MAQPQINVPMAPKGFTMQYAKDENGNRTNIENTDSEKKYYCPVCGERMMMRFGNIRIHHFAHWRDRECLDKWHYDMSEWHKGWQDEFPEETREVVVKQNDEIHRADVLVGNRVIEFQHSPISNAEFMERTTFYISAGYDVYWLFDMQDQFWSGKLAYKGDSEDKLVWKHQWHTFDGLNLKDKHVKLFFQIAEKQEDDCTIFPITWASPNFSRLIAKCEDIMDYLEFVEFCMTGKIANGIEAGEERGEEVAEATKETEPVKTCEEDEIIVEKQEDLERISPTVSGYPKKRIHTIADVNDNLPEERVDGEYCVKCPQQDYEYKNYEMCLACEYNLENRKLKDIGVSREEQYSAMEPRIKCEYVVNCMYRFRDLYEKWNEEKDEVKRITRLNDKSIVSVDVIKNGEAVTEKYEPVEIANTLLYLLIHSKANVIGACNIRTGARVKVANLPYFHQSQICIDHIKGYPWWDRGRRYSDYKCDIYYWYNKEWILEWER